MKTKIYVVICTILRSLSLLGIIYIFVLFKDIPCQLSLNILNPTDVTCGGIPPVALITSG